MDKIFLLRHKNSGLFLSSPEARGVQTMVDGNLPRLVSTDNPHKDQFIYFETSSDATMFALDELNDFTQYEIVSVEYDKEGFII